MVGRGKAKRRAPSKGRVKEDVISQLDDPLLCQILCHLPTKDAVRTSVLSTRWRTLWLWVPILELRSKDFPDSWTFVSFGNMFFDSNRVSCLDKVTLTIDDDDYGAPDDTSYFTSWIDAMIKRKIQHLDVSCPLEPQNHEMPLTLYSCKTLVYLKLALVSFEGAADLSKLTTSEFVFLPCLKTMHLELNSYPNEATFEGLISSCTVLEDLTVVGSLYNDVKVLRVLSSSLKRLCLEIAYSMHGSGSGFVIDAPRLDFLSVSARHPTDISILKNVGSITELDMCVDFGLRVFDEAKVSSKRDIIRSFLSRVSNVTDITMRFHTFEVISEYSKLEPLPQFGCMSRLRLDLSAFCFKFLPSFLKSCPNLKSLVLACEDDPRPMSYQEMNQISFSRAPECLLSSLKSVDILSCVSGDVAEMKLVSYFLENSVILEKLTLRSDNIENENVIFKKLLAIPRRSIKCQVIVH